MANSEGRTEEALDSEIARHFDLPAIRRVPADQLDQVLAPIFDRQAVKSAKCIARGLPAGPGAASGKMYLNAERAVVAAEKGEKVLLVRNETSPEDLRGMIAAEGILTAKGGVSSHAALVARQMGKVCVCGAQAATSITNPKMSAKRGFKITCVVDQIKAESLYTCPCGYWYAAD